jgi:hypothetical protein
MHLPALTPLITLLLALSGAACTPLKTYVKSDESALGRVVVYRNGVAYYERRAHVVGDTLTLRVPADKVDDFLKSLTVADAKTGAALPVAFPSRLEVGSHVDMSIQLPPQRNVDPRGPLTGRDVILSYVTDAPAWKPSYRVVVDAQGKVDLQGWAIVDNTSGEDWRAVKVGVGSSSALSFRYDLHSIRDVQREILQSQDTFAKAPPTGGSVYRDQASKQGAELVLGNLTDGEIPRMAGHPDSNEESLAMSMPSPGGAGMGSGRGAGDGLRPSKARGKKGKHAAAAEPAADKPASKAAQPRPAPAPPADDGRVRALAQSLRGRRGTIVIEGYADAGEADADTRALDRANNLRNQLIMNGVAPAQVVAQGRGIASGQRAGVRIIEQAATAVTKEKSGKPTEENAPPVGESHFESQTAMTVAKGTSAMVSIVKTAAPGQVVYLYDAESRGGDSRYAFKAVRFQNPTDSTLEGGPMTVYGTGRFIGEGLTEAIPPRGTAVVPFALDRQIVIEKKGDAQDRISQLVRLVRGVLTAEVKHVRKTSLKITNRQNAPALVLVRHTVAQGWTLENAPKIVEQYGDARLFQVDLGPGQTKTLDLEEATPMTRTLDLRSPVGIDLVRLYLDTPRVEPAFAQEMKRLLSLHGDMAKHHEAIDSLRQRADEYRLRMDELHGQIMSLQAVQAGAGLLGHLEQKMKEISQKVQESTLAVVDRQEKLMIAKVRFADGISELSLERALKTASR